MLNDTDVTMEYSINHGGRQQVNNLRAVAYTIRVDNRDCIFFDVTFDTEDFSAGPDGEGKSASRDMNDVLLEVSFAPEALADLQEHVLTPTVKAKDPCHTGLEDNMPDVSLASWKTFIDGKLVLSSEEDVQRYFFEGAGVPIISLVGYADE